MTEPLGYRRAIPLLAACLLAFAIPFPFFFGSVGVILVVVAAVVFNGRMLFRNFRERKQLWAPVLLYLWTLASWFWSDEKTEAAHILSTKLPLLLLPIAIGCSDCRGHVLRRAVLSFFSVGVAAVGLYCMWTAIGSYRAGGDVQVLFYHRLVSGLSANAVYMAWYVVVAMLFLLLEPVSPPGRWRRAGIGARALLLLVLLPFFFMLAARTLILLFVTVVLPVALALSFRKKMAFSQKALTWAFTGAVALTTAVALRQPVIQARFKELHESKPELSFRKRYQGEEAGFSNMNVRLFLWRVGLQNIGSSPGMLLLGTGVGDAHAAINERVRALGFPNMERESPKRSPFYDINLHNTFLHTALATGLPGLILSLLMAANLFVSGFRRLPRAPFLFFFALLSFSFMMQEAVFETQAGTVFYMLMYSVFAVSCYRPEVSKDDGTL